MFHAETKDSSVCYSKFTYGGFLGPNIPNGTPKSSKENGWPWLGNEATMVTWEFFQAFEKDSDHCSTGFSNLSALHSLAKTEDLEQHLAVIRHIDHVQSYPLVMSK